jgi:hypothetical protein
MCRFMPTSSTRYYEYVRYRWRVRGKRLEHWQGLHIDGNKLSGQKCGTLTRIAYRREETFWPKGWNTDEDCILTGTNFLAKMVEHWRGLQIARKRLSGLRPLWRLCLFALLQARGLPFSPNFFMINTDHDRECFTFIRSIVSTSALYFHSQ